MINVDISKFVRVYSKLDLKVRDEIIAVIDGKPITWNIAYKEITNRTEKGKEIFEKLIKMEII